MLSFIKAFFQGILYVLLSPVLLVVLVFNLIYGILIYFFYEFKSLFLFFQGLSYKSEDEETRRLKEIKNNLATPQFVNPGYQNMNPNMNPYMNPNMMYQNPNVNPNMNINNQNVNNSNSENDSEVNKDA